MHVNKQMKGKAVGVTMYIPPRLHKGKGYNNYPVNLSTTWQYPQSVVNDVPLQLLNSLPILSTASFTIYQIPDPITIFKNSSVMFYVELLWLTTFNILWKVHSSHSLQFLASTSCGFAVTLLPEAVSVFFLWLRVREGAAMDLWNMAFLWLHISELILLSANIWAHRLADSPDLATQTTHWLRN